MRQIRCTKQRINRIVNRLISNIDYPLAMTYTEIAQGLDSTEKGCEPQLKRLSLQISRGLHRELKLIALEEEETINSLVTTLLKQHLANRKEEQAVQQRISQRMENYRRLSSQRTWA